MKKIGVFLSAGPEDGGMFQYSLAIVSALGALPADEYSLVVAFTHAAWTERLLPQNCTSLRVKLGRIVAWLAVTLAFLPVSYQRWGRIMTRFSGWADALLQQGCNLWVFPRQDVWSALFPAPVHTSCRGKTQR